jgi:8-oxo-dGTP diphosphatase
VTRVAVGVLVRADGAVLLADRPSGKPYAGYWEFPGGKIERDETVEQALARELAEELGVAVRASTPWVALEHDYPHAYVRLYFRRIHDWSGEPKSNEGQQLRFLLPGESPPAPLLPAAVPAMRWIQLPTVTGFSPQTATHAHQAAQWMTMVLGRGLRQIVWHEPLLNPVERNAALIACRTLAQTYGARLLVDMRSDTRSLAAMPSSYSGQADAAAAPLALSDDGYFLGVTDLRAARGRPGPGWLGAGVQTAQDLVHAVTLGCDFAVLEPATDGPGGRPDPEHLAELCAAAPLPLYVPSELGLEHLQIAQALGAHGLAVTLSV